MQTREPSSSQSLRAANSPEGLLLRYARGRVRGFLLRQTMTVLGSTTIAVSSSWSIGLFTMVLALVGEAIDCVMLTHIKTKSIESLRQTGLFTKNGLSARVYATITAGIQAVTIAVCIALAWRMIPFVEARFFSVSFLMAAAINAGLVLRHFPEGAKIRFTVYGSVLLLLLAWNGTESHSISDHSDWLFLITVLILVYTTSLFVGAIDKGRRDRMRFELALREETEALEESRLTLAQEAKRAERLALVAKHANDSVIFSGPSGRIEWVNDAFSRIMGYSSAEVLGKMPGDVLNAPDTSPEALQILIDAHRNLIPCRVVLQNLTKSGQMVWIEISMVPVLNPDGTPDVFIAIERDVTQAIAHEKELALAKQEAVAAANAKAQFLATMSHELRTPLNGVIGVAELLQETGMDSYQADLTKTIIASGQALLTVINDVLDLSKLQADKMDLHIERMTMSDLISNAIELVRPTARKKGIGLIWSANFETLEHMADSGRVRQILLNLLGNAVKFTDTGQVEATLSISKDGENSDQIEIAVRDSGIGISADRIDQVFESFAQADSSIARKFGGTGLGLTISQLLAKQMGGDIQVSSTLGVGSVFTLKLSLPRATGIDEVVAKAKRIAPQTTLHVLIAEDNRVNMMITRKILERCVGRLSEATTGLEAIEQYLADRPDLILMDVSMPEMDGQTATREIRKLEAANGWPRCTIAALTAHAQQEEADKCFEAGMDAVLTKPLVRDDIYDLLERLAAQ